MDTATEYILAFDFGQTIGVAGTDSLVRLPEPLEDVSDIQGVKRLVDEFKPARLVVGLPRGLEGQETAQTALARQFAEELAVFNLPIHLQDEALTTLAAQARMDAKASEHGLAAGIILEDFIREFYR